MAVDEPEETEETIHTASTCLRDAQERIEDLGMTEGVIGMDL